MAEYIRAFVAVEIPPEIQERAGKLIGRLREAPVKASWVAPLQLHWTVKFLGEVRLLEVPAICKAVSAAVEPLAPFDLEALGAGAFPSVERPRTVWIGAGLGSEEMVTLHDAIEHELSKIGFRAEGRRFRPHLTIGRIRQGGSGLQALGNLLRENENFDGGLSTVFEVAILSSQLTREGPIYEPLGYAELKGRDEVG
jgi:2'-5' RNA ligase